MHRAVLLQDFMGSKEKGPKIQPSLMESWCGVDANVGREKTKRPNLTGKGDPDEGCWRITPVALAAVEPVFN